jgi:ABC-type multidrug transport system fused ATPase/permease subunit
MNSVERLKQYSRIEHEAPANIPSAKSMIAGGWPGKGEIMFEKLTISYPGRPAILKGIDLHIKSGKKVGIVGRTGAGS